MAPCDSNGCDNGLASSNNFGSRLSYTSQSILADNAVAVLVQEYKGRIRTSNHLFEDFFGISPEPSKLSKDKNSIPRIPDPAAVAAALAAVRKTAYLDQIRDAATERDMYEPLSMYMQTALDAVPSHLKKFNRYTKCTADLVLKSDTPNQDGRKPDFTTFENDKVPLHFRHVLVAWELKHKAADGPSSRERSKEIIGQVADVVRLRVASRPHQLFTLGIMLCGDVFWVSMWDRNGVVVSSPRNIHDHEELFMKIIISVNCLLDDHDFGQNPRVKLPSSFSYEPSVEPLITTETLAASDPIDAPSRFPTMQFRSQQWELRELLFQSAGALGRGTAVWRVACNLDRPKQSKASSGTPTDDSTDTPKKKRYIFRALKLSWRSQGRKSERDIHRLIKKDFKASGLEQPTTIAMLGDDDAGDHWTYDITTIAETRGDSITKDHEYIPDSGNYLTLTAIIFARVGKAIWQYDNRIEFLRGARDILKGLMALQRAGWVHRDVSAGNCLLSCSPEEGPSFVSDLELAKKLGVDAAASSDAISGTMQFMARELLDSFMSDTAREEFVYQSHHDFESYVYVLAYAVMRHEIDEFTSAGHDAAMLKKINAIYADIFGQSTVSQIFSARLAFNDKWARYMLLAESDDSMCLHELITEFLNTVSRRYISLNHSRFSDEPTQAPTPMNAKKMRRHLKRAIRIYKDLAQDTSADSDVDPEYD